MAGLQSPGHTAATGGRAFQGCVSFLELNIFSASSSVLVEAIPLAVALIRGLGLVGFVAITVLGRMIILLAILRRCYLHVASAHDLRVPKGLCAQ